MPESQEDSLDNTKDALSTSEDKPDSLDADGVITGEVLESSEDSTKKMDKDALPGDSVDKLDMSAGT